MVAHALLSLACCVGVGALLGLHAYLNAIGESTDEFFRRQREREKPAKCHFLGLPCC